MFPKYQSRQIKPRFEWHPVMDPNHPLSIGCVGLWLLNEPAGLRAHDLSGFQNHGILTDFDFSESSGWQPHKPGQVLRFDGTNDHIALGNPSSLNISGDITVSARINFTASSLNKPIVARWGTDESYALMVDYTDSNKLLFIIKVAEVSKLAVTSGTYNDGKWHLVVGIFNGANVKINVDWSVEDVTGQATSGPIDTPAQNVVIGSYNNSTGFFNSFIDEVRIYNRALSQGEIQWLYQAPYDNLIVEPTRKFWFIPEVTASGLSIPVAKHVRSLSPNFHVY